MAVALSAVLKTADGERWIDALGVLLDLEPVIADNWDALPNPVAPEVTQVWLEHRPPLMPAPTPLASEFNRRIMRDAAPSARAMRPGSSATPILDGS